MVNFVSNIVSSSLVTIPCNFIKNKLGNLTLQKTIVVALTCLAMTIFFLVNRFFKAKKGGISNNDTNFVMIKKTKNEYQEQFPRNSSNNNSQDSVLIENINREEPIEEEIISAKKIFEFKFGSDFHISNIALQNEPDYYFEKFCDFLSDSENIEIKKGNIMLNIKFEEQFMFDGGGPSRAFISTMARGVARSHCTLFDSNASSPILRSEKESDIQFVRRFGMLMGFCYNYNTKNTGKEILIGDFFNSKIFEIAFNFIHRYPQCKSMSDLSFNEKLPQYKKLISILKGSIRESCEKVISFLSKPNWNKTEMEEVQCFLKSVVYDSEESGKEREDLQSFLEEALDSRLLGIFILSEGMASSLSENLNDLKSIEAKKFSHIVQGQFDRELIVKELEEGDDFSNSGKQKITWLKEWIVDKNTPEQMVRNFLFFATSSFTLRAHFPKIKISLLNDSSPCIEANTCLGVIYIADSFITSGDGTKLDNTKEKFIEFLRLSIQNSINKNVGY